MLRSRRGRGGPRTRPATRRRPASGANTSKVPAKSKPPWASRSGGASASPHSWTAMASPWLSTVRCRSGRRAPGYVIARACWPPSVASPWPAAPRAGAGGPSRSTGSLAARCCTACADGPRATATSSPARSALVLTAGVQAVSGALFWLIAARVDTQTDVGHATALFTSVLFVAFVAGLGQPVAAARYAAGRTRDDHVLFAWGALATTVASAGRRRRLPRCVVSPPAVDELRNWHGAARPGRLRVPVRRHRPVAPPRRAADDPAPVGARPRPGLDRRRRPLPAAAPPGRRRPGRVAARGGGAPDGGVGLRRHRAAPARSPATGTTSARCRPPRARMVPVLARQLGLHPHLPGADLRHAGHRAGERRRRPERQLLRRVGRGRPGLLRARRRSARPCSPRAAATAPTCAPRCAWPSSSPGG